MLLIVYSENLVYAEDQKTSDEVAFKQWLKEQNGFFRPLFSRHLKYLGESSHSFRIIPGILLRTLGTKPATRVLLGLLFLFLFFSTYCFQLSHFLHVE